MAEGWYCKIADQELGPLSADQLRALASQGRISPDDPIRREGMDSWAPARRVKGLFPPAKSTANSAVNSAVNSAASSPSSASAKSLPRAKPLVAKPLSQPPSAGQASTQSQTAKAPPMARPVSPSEDQSTTPAAIPMARPPGGLNQFSIVTDDASSPAARGQNGGPTKIVGKKSRPGKVMAVAGGLVVAAGLVAGGVALVLYGGSGNDQADTSGESAEGDIPDDLDLSEDAVASVNSSDGVPPSAMAASSTIGSGQSVDDDAWTDASTGSITRGDVTVRIESAELGRPHLVSGSGGRARPMDTYLILRLELFTKNESGGREYAGWGKPARGVDLRDDRNRPHNLKFWTADGMKIDGQVRDVILKPGGPTDDVLVFGPWPEQPDGVEYLRLQLPAAAFGGEGSLRFEIPAEMIAAADESRPEEPSHEEREPADGENPFRPDETESVEQEEPVEETPVPRDRIPIPGLGDDDE